MKDNELGFSLARLDNNHVYLNIAIGRDIHTGEVVRVLMTDTQFDLLMETIIAFTDSEPDRVVHFAESA